MHWIAQASASGVQSIKYVVTAAWSGPTIFFRRLFKFLGDALFFPTISFFCFFGK
jgi:hypothetical protein